MNTTNKLSYTKTIIIVLLFSSISGIFIFQDNPKPIAMYFDGKIESSIIVLDYPYPISVESNLPSSSPSISSDSEGNLYVVWQDVYNNGESGSDRDIFLRRYNASNDEWSSTELISTESTSHSENPCVSCDDDGNIGVIWSDFTHLETTGPDRDIFFKYFNSSTREWNYTKIMSTFSNTSSSQPKVKLDGKGNVFVSWLDYTDYMDSGTDRDLYFRWYNLTKNSWSESSIISENCSNSNFPVLDVDNNDNLHIIWDCYTHSFDDSGEDRDIIHRKFNITTEQWGKFEVVSNESTYHSYCSDFSFDKNNNIHAVWYEYYDYDMNIKYNCKNVTTNKWSITKDFSPDVNYISRYDYSVNIEIDKNSNTAYLFWMDTLVDGNTPYSIDLLYRTINLTSDELGDVGIITSESTIADIGNPSTEIDNQGTFFVVWDEEYNYRDSDMDKDIFFKRNTDNEFPVISEIEDLTFFYGDTNRNLTWSVFDTTYNDSTYQIYQNSTLIKSDSWEFNDEINCNLINLNPGVYNYSLIINDGYDSITQDDVLVSVLNILPEISSPEDFNFTVGDLNQNITWSVSDLSINESSYEIYKNNVKNISGNWNSIDEIIIDISDLDPGNYNYTLILNDGYNGIIQDEVYIDVLDILPELSNPEDFSYIVGEQNKWISWNTYDLSTDEGSYTIIKNFEEFKVGTWESGDEISLNVTGLEPGSYNFSLILNDGFGGIQQDDVFITVHNIFPTISNPNDLVYEFDNLNHHISWIPFDLSINTAEFMVFCNDSEIFSGNWQSNQNLSINLSDLNPGNYNYTIILNDGYEGIISDEVFVTVINNNPTLSCPDDFSISYGDLDKFITWKPSDISVDTSAKYIILKDGNEYCRGKWISDELIKINVTGRILGEFNYTIIVYDGYDGIIQNSIIVKVIDSENDNLSQPFVIGSIALGSIIILVIGIYLFRRKHKRDLRDF